MNITSKSRYGIKVMLALAEVPAGDLIQRNKISTEQLIPSEYMDHILVRLRKAGLIETVRGRYGGLTLAKDPSVISAWQIINAVEETTLPVQCLDDAHNCIVAESCGAKSAWSLISDSIATSLRGISLTELMKSSLQVGGYASEWIDAGPHECKGPSKSNVKKI